MNYGLTKDQTDRLVKMGPEICDFFEEVVFWARYYLND